MTDTSGPHKRSFDAAFPLLDEAANSSTPTRAEDEEEEVLFAAAVPVATLDHVANLTRASKEDKIKTTKNRFKHFCGQHPGTYKGFQINANTAVEEVPYEVWDDNSDHSLVGHFMTYLTTACYLKQPSKRLAYNTAIQLASTLKEYVINLHKAK